jgi:hypothetical protein
MNEIYPERRFSSATCLLAVPTRVSGPSRWQPGDGGVKNPVASFDTFGAKLVTLTSHNSWDSDPFV